MMTTQRKSSGEEEHRDEEHDSWRKSTQMGQICNARAEHDGEVEEHGRGDEGARRDRGYC